MEFESALWRAEHSGRPAETANAVDYKCLVLIGVATRLAVMNIPQFISDQRIDATIITCNSDAPTLATAAAALNVSPAYFAKSLLIMERGVPVLVIAPAEKKISFASIADHLGISKKQIQLASKEEVFDITGFPVGSVPPFGHKTPIQALADFALQDLAFLLLGGGAPNALIRIAPKEMLRVTNARVLPLAN